MPLTRIVFHQFVEENEQFRTCYKDNTQKYSVCLLKKPEIGIFIATNSPTEKFWQQNFWDMVDREPISELIQKADESDRLVFAILG